MSTPDQGPVTFRLDDPAIRGPVHDTDEGGDAPVPPPPRRRPNWFARLVLAAAALVGVVLGELIAGILADLILAGGWPATLVTVCLGLVVAGLIAWAGLEAAALFRLDRLEHLRRAADAVGDDLTAAQAVVADLDRLYGHRDAGTGPRGDAADGRDLLIAAERELLHPRDAAAETLILATARRTALITAVSPFMALDMAVSLALDLALIRRIARLYGGRPGWLATLRLLRGTAANFLVAGGLDAADGVLHDLVGGGLVRAVSTKASEGVINGMLTIRLGLAARRACRPMAPLARPEPGILDLGRRLVAELGTRLTGRSTP